MSGYDLELEFDSLQPIEKKVRVGKKDYLMREAFGDTISAYQLAKEKVIEVADGKTKFLDRKSEVDIGLVLLAGCFFEIVEKSPNGEPTKLDFVPTPVVKKWPGRVLLPLIKMAKEVSGLETENETVESLEKEKKGIEERIKRLKGKDEKNPTTASSESTEIGSV